jgi:hypothetical protein
MNDDEATIFGRVFVAAVSVPDLWGGAQELVGVVAVTQAL